MAEERKRKKYENVLDRVDFVPLAVESIGGAGLSLLNLLRQLSSRSDARSGTPGSYRRMLRALSTALQLGNACILELHGRSELPSFLTTNAATRISLPSLKAFGIGPAPDAS